MCRGLRAQASFRGFQASSGSIARVIDPLTSSRDAVLRARSETAAFGESNAPLQRAARFSRDRRYRYLISRTLANPTPGRARCGEGNGSKDGLLFVMLNPSIADAQSDDPTLRRCMAFARQWGFSRLDVVNLYARICTNPRRLFEGPDPEGPRNNFWIRHATANAALIVCAWGNSGGEKAAIRARAVTRLLAASGRALHHLGLTASGAPRHPLYVPGSARPVLWDPGKP